MRGFAKTSLTFAVAVVMTSCTLLVGGDLDGASSGGIDAATSSSGADAREDDAPVARPDARDAETSSASSYCSTLAPAPKVCEDFDHLPLSKEWTAEEEAGQSRVVSDQFVSGPNALKVSLDTQGECKYSRLERGFEGLTGTTRFSVKTRLRLARPWGDGQAPLVIGMNGGPGEYCAAIFYIYANPDGTTKGAGINVQSNVTPNHFESLSGFPSVEEWSEMTVVASRPDIGGTRFTVTFRDPSGFSLTTERDFPECAAWKDASVHLGFHCDSGRASAYYDNVVVDWN